MKLKNLIYLITVNYIIRAATQIKKKLKKIQIFQKKLPTKKLQIFYC